MKQKRLSFLMLILSGLALLNMMGSPVFSQSPSSSGLEGTGYRLDWVAVGEVSGGDSASSHYHLSATIGQMGAGMRSESEHYALCVGFQCAAAANEYRVYLPLIVR